MGGGGGGGAEFYASCVGDDGSYLFHAGAGGWRASASGKTVPVGEPATGAATAFRVQACTPAEVDEAFAAAAAAQKAWARTPLYKRAEALHAIAGALRANWEPLAAVLTREVAKPAKDAKTEVIRSADLLDYCAEEGVRSLGEGKLMMSDSFPGTERNKLCMVHKVPLGVVLCIPPFNYPVNLCVSKIGPALIAGNAVVIKPPTQGSVAGVMMMKCILEAGLPEGLVSLVTGRGSEIGDYLVQHPAVNCISFTGGDTGLSIAKKAPMVPLQMELGGKDACVVLPDADIDLAAANIVKGGFSYSGQRCTAVKLVVAFDAIADELVEKVKAKVDNLKVGKPEDNCDITAVVSAASADFIEGLVKDAEAKGAELKQAYKREGNLLWPVLVDRVSRDMRLCWEEPFGPVVPVVRVSSEEEALDLVNSSKYGLQGCVFTKDVNAAIRIADKMETGTVQVNAAPARGPDHFPFQGVKDSGIGSQGVVNSIELMVKTKTTVLNLDAPSYAVA